MSAFLALAPDALNGTSLAKAELSYKSFVPSGEHGPTGCVFLCMHCLMNAGLAEAGKTKDDRPKKKARTVQEAPVAAASLVCAVLLNLRKLNENYVAISRLHRQDPLRQSTQTVIDKQEQRVLNTLVKLFKKELPVTNVKDLNVKAADEFLFSLKGRKIAITECAINNFPALLEGRWDMWLGWLDITESHFVAEVLRALQLYNGLQSARTVHPPPRPQRPDALAAGWALEHAPIMNPADEGQLATPETMAALGYAGPPALPPGSQENVPADGLCLAYCLLGARDVRRLQAMRRNRFGFVRDPQISKDFKKGAKIFREQACARGLLTGYAEQAEDIAQGAFPEGQALHWYAEELGGSILITPSFADVTYVYGQGPIVAHVLNHYQVGEDGESAPHFLLLQSWIPQPRRKRGKRHSSSSSSSSGSSSSSSSNG